LENKGLAYHILKAVEQLETRIADKVATTLLEKMTELDGTLSSTEPFLKDKELCEHLQISTSHFYKIKRANKKIFPVYDLGGSKRYKLGEVACFFKSKE